MANSLHVPSSPSSPGTSPLQLAEFLPRLLKRFLESSLQDLAVGCPLSREFCTALLKTENYDHCNILGRRCVTSRQFLQQSLQESTALEVVSFPIYQELAYVLYKWIANGSFPRELLLMPGLSEDVTWKSKIDEWNDKVVKLGLTLEENIKFQFQVQEPFFSQLKDGSKTIEGRCAVGAYKRIRSGDVLLVNEVLLLEVQVVKHYASFASMLVSEGLERVLPGIACIDEGVMVYRRFYVEEKEKVGGVVAIHVHNLPATIQPFKIINDILTELQMVGIRALLGFQVTRSTVVDSFPPSITALQSSVLAP